MRVSRPLISRPAVSVSQTVSPAETSTLSCSSDRAGCCAGSGAGAKKITTPISPSQH
jgi:hypothetical protein